MKRIYIGVVVILILAITPIALWYLDDEKPLNVAILDKTVPNETYREHLGVNWFLNHYKYTMDNQPMIYKIIITVRFQMINQKV